ncbi:hypothetical protein AB0M02_35585 [Actinoplanes sp. NPDC051861]|uniref:hypothetical protein n=1 Tax=Actinoplanes sp. NPDC051861 TaxID=3155170 RepID=UPI003448C359
MHIVVLDSLHAQPGEATSFPGVLLLLAAVFLLLAALRMMRQALLPLREIMRVVGSAAAVAILMTVALALIVVSLIAGI